MKEIITYLSKLGFSKIEVKLYLILLKHGSMTVSQIAEKAKVNRTAAYTYIDNLFAKGILIKTKGKKNEISANAPEKLNYLVEEKLNSAQQLKSELPKIVNSLHLNFSSATNFADSETVYYRGLNGVNKIYEDALSSRELRSYVDFETLRKLIPENQSLFPEALKNNKELRIFEIIQDTLISRKLLEELLVESKHTKQYHFKFFPKDVKLEANDVMFYDGKVAIINIADSKNISGMVINNKEYYNNCKLLFDLLWRLLPEPKK